MRIRTRLALTAVLVLAALAAMAALTGWRQAQTAALLLTELWLDRLELAAQEQALLAAEMLLYPGERVREQWTARWSWFGQALARAPDAAPGSVLAPARGCCRSERAAALLADIEREHGALGTLFARAVALQAQTGAGGFGAKGAGAGAADARLLEQRYAVRLLARTRAVAALLAELAASERTASERRQRIADRVVIALELALVAAVLAALVLLGRSLLRPLERLQRGFERVGAGDLDHRVDSGRRDELGDLARGFDRMTEQVAAQTRRLEASQAALAAANRKLEARVAERTAALDRANQDLEDAVRRLYTAGEELAQNERLATVGRLAAGITHELNNPLMGALNYVQHVRGELGEDPRAEWLVKAERAIARAASVTDRLLGLGRAAPDRRSTLDITALIENALLLAQAELRRHGIGVERRLAADLPAVVGQAEALQQALLLVLLNAADAVAGSADRRIRVSAGVKGDRVQLRIEDSGPGVAPELGARIFEPLFTTKPRGQGGGLGLTIARRMLEGMGGTLELAQPAAEGRHDGEEPLPGACFVLALRPAQDDAEDADVLS